MKAILYLGKTFILLQHQIVLPFLHLTQHQLLALSSVRFLHQLQLLSSLRRELQPQPLTLILPNAAASDPATAQRMPLLLLFLSRDIQFIFLIEPAHSLQPLPSQVAITSPASAPSDLATAAPSDLFPCRPAVGSYPTSSLCSGNGPSGCPRQSVPVPRRVDATPSLLQHSTLGVSMPLIEPEHICLYYSL